MTDLLLVDALPAGTKVGDFDLLSVLSATDTVIAYRVRESATGADFVLREFAPASLVRRQADGRLVTTNMDAEAAFQHGVARFLANASRSAARNHPALARSIRAFRANGTAVQLLACPPGRLLSEQVAGTGAVPAERLSDAARPLLDLLAEQHTDGSPAGRIAPDQVMLPDLGGAVWLGAGMDVSVEHPGDPVLAPEHLAENGELGPWTDIYALAATLYTGLFGSEPPPASERLRAQHEGGDDPLQLPREFEDSRSSGNSAGTELLTLIRRGLVLDPAARPRSVREWRARLGGAEADAAADQDGRKGAAPTASSRRGWLGVAFAALVLAIVVTVGYFALEWQSRDAAQRSTAQALADAAAAAEENRRWQQALETDAVVAYRAFIEDFPESPRIAQAREFLQRLEEKAWPGVLEENTRAAFEAHLETFPDGRYATEALARIEAFRQEEARLAREQAERRRRDEAAWEVASADGSVAALDRYLAEWPAGAHAAEARELRGQMQVEHNDTARFAQAREADTLASWRAYLDDFPAGRHVDAALAAIDRLTLRPGKAFRDCETCPEMVVVPAGSFWQGSADSSPLAVSLEKPRRRVTIDAPFAIGKYEVTLAEWDHCVEAGGCETRPADNGWGRGRRPAILVSWHDAAGYAAWLSELTGERYALPSESEWEYAARAGEEGDWLGGSAEAVCAWANVAGAESGFDWRHTGCADRMAASTALAGSLRPNDFGLHDMIGNVAEWTRDCMNLSYLEAPTDGSAWSRGLCSSRMTRGGSWFSGSRDIRLPARFNLKSGDRNDFTGLRVVRRVEPQEE
ncbi:SUMF1/EgtB/PvdO family nonheme iron enzyme [Elongatibacter sediminis]|uniref:SUMF1/EgtB/PvdO family nonheme iron enzyme n=1 Tax=Elongatibacter sediminis TaxID=3119006 RepID=A0AAW9REN4_9GAMM